MFLIVFNALFTEFCNCACAKKIVMLIRIRHNCAALLHKKTVLSLETSSEINFEFIKSVKKGKCLPLTKTNREYYINVTFPDWVIVENITTRNAIITFPEMIFSTITQSENIYFIVPNIRSFIFYRLKPTVVRGVPKEKWCTASYLYAWMKNHLSQKWFF